MLMVGRSVPARYTSPVRARIVIANGFCVVLRPVACVLWHGSRLDCGSSDLSVRHRVGGPTTGESYTRLSSATFPQFVILRGDILACLFRASLRG